MPVPVRLAGPACRRRNGKLLRAVAAAQRARAHFQRRRAAAQTPQDLVSSASDYLRSAMAGADPDLAAAAAREHAAALAATADRLLADRVDRTYDYVA